jgi:hypothetical protein
MRLKQKSLQLALDTIDWANVSQEDSLGMRFHTMPLISITSGSLAPIHHSDWIIAYRHEENPLGGLRDIWCFSFATKPF